MMVPLEGPVGVGALVDAVLLGCVIVQSVVYYKNSRGDAWFLKLLVSLILFLLLSHLVCMAAWLWASAQGGPPNAPVPDYATILFGVSSVLAALISFFERCFFSHRILKLSGNHLMGFVAFICCIFALTAALGVACTFFTQAAGDPSLTGQLGSSWTFPLVIVSGLVCDLGISIATAFYLRSQHPPEVADTVGRVARVLFFIAETSTVTSLFDVVAVLVYWLTKTNFAWVGLLVAMPGVFANALLAALNARGHLSTDIKHERVLEFGEKLIDKRAKRPPIMVTISQRVEKRSETSPV